MNNHTGDAHGHMCAHTYHLHTHTAHSIYTVHIYGYRVTGAQESRPDKSAAMHECHFTDGDGREGWDAVEHTAEDRATVGKPPLPWPLCHS